MRPGCQRSSLSRRYPMGLTVKLPLCRQPHSARCWPSRPTKHRAAVQRLAGQETWTSIPSRSARLGRETDKKSNRDPPPVPLARDGGNAGVHLRVGSRSRSAEGPGEVLVPGLGCHGLANQGSDKPEKRVMSRGKGAAVGKRKTVDKKIPGLPPSNTGDFPTTRTL